MLLTSVTIQFFRNFVGPQTIQIEDDLTVFVGKNESGKTTILRALHGLNPANTHDATFDLKSEYPRWRLAGDRRRNPRILDLEPVCADFVLDAADCDHLAAFLPARPPVGAIATAARSYGNTPRVELRAGDEPIALTKTHARAVWGRLPRFFYFSNYENLPGQCDLTRLAGEIARGAAITPQERTVVALLAHAGEAPADFLDEDYDSRKAELQAASVDLSRRAFEYWGQNTDLAVVFDTDNVRIDDHTDHGDPMHRFLKIQLRDGRHGDVETNFETRSTGFRWFFSFFAAFSEFQDSADQLIVLLDEPGTSLHGDAQSDFVRFVSDELAVAKQTLYTTHSQHMVDPTKYEHLRAVHDRATRAEPDLAVVVAPVDLSADRSTLLPIEAALGYAVSQHLFRCPGQHLAVAENSDLIYLQRMTEYLLSAGDDGGLNPRLTTIPVGGADNMPAFVALMGRQRALSALIGGSRTGEKWNRIRVAAEANGVALSSLVACADADPAVPRTAELEDLFAIDDYLKLYNWAFGTRITTKDVANTAAPVLGRLADALGPFDRTVPAHALTEHRKEFFAAIDRATVERFKQLFALLNATVRPSRSHPAIADELRALADPARHVSAREIKQRHVV